MKLTGKTIALSTAGVGVVVLVATEIAERDWIREQWYVHRFEAGDEKEKLHAAERLGALGSARATSWLFEEMHKD